MSANWIMDIVRNLLFLFDGIVYWLIDVVYQLFMLISETGIFHSEDIQDFAGRIYFFLGLIMVFKVSISIIQFIANPDVAKDGKIGAPKLLKNVVVILVGIILIPYVFQAAYSLQSIVLKDNIIGSLILGMNYTEGSEDEEEDHIKIAGRRMAFTTFSAFFSLDKTIVGIDGTTIFSGECAASPFSTDGTINPACSESAQTAISIFLSDSGKNQYFQQAYMENEVGYLEDMDFNYTIEDINGEDKYMFDYTVLVSTIAGAFIIYILLGFCVDIAVRNVKLGFLQLIAPIPLISKIDPKKGDEVFNGWVKQCTSTYLDLFGRLVAIYFAIFLLSLITGGLVNVVDDTEGTDNLFVKVFFIFGILLFAKDLPNLLKKLIPGLQLDGKSLGLRNKISQAPLIGGAANKALGFAGRTGVGLAKGFGKIGGKALGAGARYAGGKIANTNAARALNGSAAAQTFHNFKAGAANRYRKVSAGAAKIGDKINELTDGTMSDIGLDAKSTFSGMGASVLDGIGILESRKNQILNRQSSGKVEIERNKKLADAISAMESRAIENIKNGEGGKLSEKFYRDTAEIDEIRNMSNEEWLKDTRSYDANGNLVNKADALADAQLKLDRWLNSNEDTGAKSQYINTALDENNNDISDGTMVGMYQTFSAQAQANGIETVPKNGEDIHKVLAKAKTRNSEIQREQIDGNNELAKIEEQIRSAKEFQSKK